MKYLIFLFLIFTTSICYSHSYFNGYVNFKCTDKKGNLYYYDKEARTNGIITLGGAMEVGDVCTIQVIRNDGNGFNSNHLSEREYMR